MNHHQWSQRLRGHINLKLCMGLGAIALAGAFVVNLPAQDKTASPSASPSTEECCGTNPQPLVGFGITDGTTDEIKKARLDNSTRKTAKSLVPKGVTLTGTITGPFALADSVEFEEKTIKLSEADDYLFKLKAVYNVAIELKSQKRNVFGVALRPNTPLSSMGKSSTESTEAPLSVSTDVGVQNLGLQGAATGNFLAHNGVSWVVATRPPSTTPTYSGETVVQDGVQMRGQISGLFVNFAKDKIEQLTHDITDTSEFGPTGYGYQADVEVKYSTPNLHGATLRSANGKVALLTVATDTPVKTIHLRGVLDGTRWGSSGLGWTAVTTEDMKRAGLVGQSPVQKPRFVSLAYTGDVDSTTPRSLLFVPEEHKDLSILRVQTISSIVKAIFDIFLGKHLDKLKGQYALSSTPLNPTDVTSADQSQETGPFNTCKDERTDFFKVIPGTGYVVEGTSDNAQAGILVNTDWQNTYTPAPDSEYAIKDKDGRPLGVKVNKGQKVFVQYFRGVTKSRGKIVVRFADNGKTTPNGNTITYTIDVTHYLESTNPGQRVVEPCPTPTPTPVPTPTPTRDPEDPEFNGTPAPQNPPTTGGTTPVAPPPVAQP